MATIPEVWVDIRPTTVCPVSDVPPPQWQPAAPPPRPVPDKWQVSYRLADRTSVERVADALGAIGWVVVALAGLYALVIFIAVPGDVETAEWVIVHLAITIAGAAQGLMLVAAGRTIRYLRSISVLLGRAVAESTGGDDGT